VQAQNLALPSLVSSGVYSGGRTPVAESIDCIVVKILGDFDTAGTLRARGTSTPLYLIEQTMIVDHDMTLGEASDGEFTNEQLHQYALASVSKM
jgi:hypothetical protein